MRRVLVSLTMLLLVAASPTGLAADARTSIPEGMCSLWTVRQASSAMGERMEVVSEDPDRCVWYSRDDHSGSISTLSAGLWGGDPGSDLPFIDQARESGPRWTREEEVAGVPVLMTDVRRFGRNREVTAAAFPDATTWLNLNATSVIAKDVRRAVRRMVELSAPKLAATSLASAAPSPIGSGAPVGSGAPPIADACSLLTVAQVSEAIGESMSQADSTPDQCIWGGDQGTLLNLTILPADAVDATSSMIDRRRSLSPDVEDIDVAGLPGLFEVGPLLGVPSVYIYPSSSVEVELELVAMREFDTRAALEALGALVVPHLGSLPGPSTAPVSPAASAPAPSAAVRSGLAALFPAEIGGGPVTIDSELTGREFLAQIVNFDPMEQQVTRALRRRDRTIGDLSFAIGRAGSGSLIAAFRVEGGPIRPLVNTLLESLAMERTGQEVPAASVAGKDAFGVSGGFLIGGEGVAYPEGEVLWLVFSFGDEQAEIFEQLP